MSLLGILFGIIGLLGSIIVALWFRGKSQQSQHETEIAETHAEQYKALDQDRQKLQQKTTELDQQHRQEIQHETKHISDRNDFDNDWSDGV